MGKNLWKTLGLIRKAMQHVYWLLSLGVALWSGIAHGYWVLGYMG